MFEMLSFGSGAILGVVGTFPMIKIIFQGSATRKQSVVAGAALLVGLYGVANALHALPLN